MTSTTTTLTKTGEKIQTVLTPVTTSPAARKPPEDTESMQSIQQMLQNIQDTMAMNQDTMVKNYEDIKNNLGEVKEDLRKMRDNYEKVQESVKKNEERIQGMEVKLSTTEGRLSRVELSHLQATKELEDEIIILEMEKAAFQLRFQNITEEKDENLPDVVATIIAEATQIDKEVILRDMDEIYRLQTNYARRMNLPREVHLRLSKKSLREQIYKKMRDEQPSYKGKTIITLRQTPRRVREMRNKYQFLTSQLKKNNIWYKWLLPDGILVTWQDKRIRLDNVEDAQEFFETHFISAEDTEIQESSDNKSQEDLAVADDQVGNTDSTSVTVYRRQPRQARNRYPRYR